MRTKLIGSVQNDLGRQLNGIIEKAVSRKASDIHLQEGRDPLFRCGDLLEDAGGVTVEASLLQTWLDTLGPKAEETGFASAAYTWDRGIRCRVHISRELAGIHAVIRLLYPLADFPPDEDQPFLNDLGRLKDGLILLCGPTGSGKTTAIWRILSAVNEARKCHIITLEEPIEYVLQSKETLISQREFGRHFSSYEDGLKQSLRQDPDIILIGEIRDFLTMEAALHAAETGHLVLSTLHTRSAPQAISRVVGMSPAGRQADIRCRLALILQAVLAQQGKQEEEGYRIFREILVVTPAVSQLIRSGKEYQLPAVMQTGAQFGMRTMAQALQRGRRL